ncbi:hypothetical protein K493DRAFT_339926 [Basidiobolus meristosporus CBS 931.73]|uniref:Uncharacterized protein n=1 Tax=Basidiobolus meristosporus CBS 931.73 TaxID=1314790 RepID=A0A1Y1XYK5_9FUNG|nr:hypothetical protein K493DRAFT_339926 [Basidiobolus meristosporus CBS 931.73]|eukprot:ORX90566.1 hypothetical protein K493DRAFT_339926 [Basidiobolus meristosporus CBS 931.73]
MEAACKDYLNALGGFEYFKANRFSSKLHKLSPSVGTILTRLATCEALYTSLAFLKPKFFRRENFLNILYATIGNDAIKEAKVLFSGGSPTPVESAASAFLNQLCRALNDLAIIRQEQINIYRSLSGESVGTKYEAVRDKISNIQTRLQQMPLGESLGLLSYVLKKELDVLYHIFSTQIALGEYNFKKSTVNLYLAKNELFEWKKACSLSEAQDRNTRPFRNTPILPNNLSWTTQFINGLMSKMTLYFQETLLEKERSIGGELKTLWKRVEPDYSTFISLIYEVTPDKPFHKKGHVFLTGKYEAPSGLMSFPCIYSYPEVTLSFVLIRVIQLCNLCVPKNPPYEHWPNLISIMQTNDISLSSIRTTYVHFYDKKVGSTYYLIRADAQITLAVIFLDKHMSPENNTVEFMRFMARHLRNVEIFEMMSKME